MFFFRLGECALVAGDCGVIAGLEPVVHVENFLLAHLCDSTLCRTCFGVILRVPREIPDVLEFVVFFCVLRSTSLPVSGAHSKCASFNLAFHEDFHNSAALGYDLIQSIVRGGQRRCNCDSSQKYMRACVKFLILKHIFLLIAERTPSNTAGNVDSVTCVA